MMRDTKMRRANIAQREHERAAVSRPSRKPHRSNPIGVMPRGDPNSRHADRTTLCQSSAQRARLPRDRTSRSQQPASCECGSRQSGHASSRASAESGPSATPRCCRRRRLRRLADASVWAPFQHPAGSRETRVPRSARLHPRHRREPTHLRTIPSQQDDPSIESMKLRCAGIRRSALESDHFPVAPNGLDTAPRTQRSRTASPPRHPPQSPPEKPAQHHNQRDETQQPSSDVLQHSTRVARLTAAGPLRSSHQHTRRPAPRNRKWTTRE